MYLDFLVKAFLRDVNLIYKKPGFDKCYSGPIAYDTTHLIQIQAGRFGDALEQSFIADDHGFVRLGAVNGAKRSAFVFTLHYITG